MGDVAAQRGSLRHPLGAPTARSSGSRALFLWKRHQPLASSPSPYCTRTHAPCRLCAQVWLRAAHDAQRDEPLLRVCRRQGRCRARLGARRPHARLTSVWLVSRHVPPAIGGTKGSAEGDKPRSLVLSISPCGKTNFSGPAGNWPSGLPSRWRRKTKSRMVGSNAPLIVRSNALGCIPIRSPIPPPR